MPFLRSAIPSVLLVCAACASSPTSQGDGAKVPTSPSSRESGAATVTSPPSIPPAPSTAPTAGTASRSLAEEMRAALNELVAVDTSHGHETDALKPLAERLRAAGLTGVELLESAPGRGNLIARYKGNGSKKPLLLIAHIDVVPVEGQSWSVPPFQVTEKDGFLWGRGVNDDKHMASEMVAVALELAKTKAKLSRDVIFAFTAGEETGGQAGAKWLAQNHIELIDAEFALNEGAKLRLTDNGEKMALVEVGVAEKTFLTFHLSVKGAGGHSSLPTFDGPSAVFTLARALMKVEPYRFPAHLLPVTKEQFRNAAAFAEKPLADVLKRIATTGRISPSDDRFLTKEPAYNAMIRTTCVTTQLKAAPQDNQLPTNAEASVNCRLMPDDTAEHVLGTLTKLIDDPVVEIRKEEIGAGPYSPIENPVPEAIKEVAGRAWPGVPVTVAMGPGATDSRHLRAIGIASYGVPLTPVTKQELAGGHIAHGPDERHPVRWEAQSVGFFHDLVVHLAQ